MVYLSKIYTKVGDKGNTALGTGTMVSKDHPRIEAYGTVDEFNSNIGMVANLLPAGGDLDFVRSIQNDLFDLGADLCVPAADDSPDNRLRIRPQQWERLEKKIDEFNERLSPLNSFILPGGSVVSCWLHICRTVCRRSERLVVHLSRLEAVNENVIIYLNRLSDLLFVMARVYNNNGADDVLWTPGKSQAN
ncbi:cob(I)yrinic acid a,c-diamide adenosyltransferase [bacterium]|jgi:cob(I)alamin adenosyltransferase|nr:cob(I)yrinic acid a,c-diamide adenosyltransferase [bacterium]